MSLFRSKTLLIGGALVMAGAAALKNRQKVAGLIGARSSVPEPPPFAPPAATRSASSTSVPTPQPANYDAAGPPENNATHVPAPDPIEPEAFDEEAEVAAAAAEAANIGGSVSDYAGSEADAVADEAERPLMEAGEGEAEGFEQAEHDLEVNAELIDAGESDPAARLDEIIEQAGNPAVGEIVEPHETATAGEADEAVDPETLSATGERHDADLTGGEDVSPTRSTVTRFFDEREPEADTSETPISGDPADAEAHAVETGEAGSDAGSRAAKEEGQEGDDSSWQTWSGQASKP